MQQQGKRSQARTRKMKFLEVENEVFEKTVWSHTIEESKKKGH